MQVAERGQTADQSPAPESRWERWAARAMAAALALPMAVFAATGWYARYTADDFCWAGVLRTQGFFKAQVLWYSGYSPRYAFTFLVNLVELAGPAIVPFLPILAMLVWLATLTWALGQFAIRAWPALLLAEAMAVLTLDTAPDLPQSLYWQTGMLTYLLPLMMATFLIGWIRRGSDAPWALVISLLVTFVAGGLSETYLIPQNVAVTLALSACLIWGSPSQRRTYGPHLAAALVGGVLALAAIVVAPATAYRVGGTPADLWLASSAAIATAGVQALRLARYFPYAMLLALVLPGLLGLTGPRLSRRWFWLVTAIAVITVPFCYFPSFYAQNGNPPARSLIVPGSILIGYLLFLGYAAAELTASVLHTRWRLGLAYAAALIPLGIVALHWPGVADAAQHAAMFDAEEAHIEHARAQGQTDVLVRTLPRYLGENFVTTDPRDWFNVCVARYYGLRTIAASEEAP
jgi:hypothetical protein